MRRQEGAKETEKGRKSRSCHDGLLQYKQREDREREREMRLLSDSYSVCQDEKLKLSRLMTPIGIRQIKSGGREKKGETEGFTGVVSRCLFQKVNSQGQ
jgi:hypothetical protein